MKKNEAKPKTRHHAVNVSLPESLSAELKAISAETGISVSRILADGAKRYLVELYEREAQLAKLREKQHKPAPPAQ
jgi:hypothetical protein